MAIDSILYADTDRLAYTDKTFYPVKIPVSHWQLRHYISAPEKDTLYYASGNEVYHLNTATKKRKHLTTLPFEARCTASGFGYLCVGGEEDGHFAVIKLAGTGPLRTIDVDAPLPLDHLHAQRGAPRAANVKVERIGEEIVNSISIHQIQDEEAHLYDVVALLTNNDKTVRLYSLSQGVETAVLDLPCPMNHATMSPDGTILVAVGDSNEAFFFRRALQQSPPQIPKPHNRLNTTSVVWELANLVKLGTGDRSPQGSGYFTTAWSPNGQLVAVGSEGGHISVFDMQLFADCAPDEGDDAIVATIPSTRPNNPTALYPGAVRSMVFSPEPWDLLIWAEDQGRICIGDLRTGLRTKQVIELKPDEEGLKKCDLIDLPDDESGVDEQLEDEYWRQYQENPDSATPASFAGEFFAARERLRRANHSPTHFPTLSEAATLEDDPRGLTAHEQQILESLRTTRQRAEARAQGNSPRSVNYTSSTLFSTPSDRVTAGNRTGDAARPFSDVLVNHNDPYPGFPELSRSSQRPSTNSTQDYPHSGDNSLPPLHSIRQYLMLRDREQRQREARSPPSTQTGAESQLRRRTSIPSTNTDTTTVPPHAARANVTMTASPEAEDENPWRTISNAMSLARGPLFESPQSTENPRARERDTPTQAEQLVSTRTEQLRRIAQQRDRLRGLRRDFDSGNAAAAELYESLTTLRGLNAARQQGATFGDGYDVLMRRAGRDAVVGVRTAGLAASHDGRTLWAACEEGIFEIEIRTKARMGFPAMQMA
ncbi:hypothetical protein MBLNU459_g4792t1 [Dothideomycetes sp. NU459]